MYGIWFSIQNIHPVVNTSIKRYNFSHSPLRHSALIIRLFFCTAAILIDFPTTEVRLHYVTRKVIFTVFWWSIRLCLYSNLRLGVNWDFLIGLIYFSLIPKNGVLLNFRVITIMWRLSMIIWVDYDSNLTTFYYKFNLLTYRLPK